MENSGSSGQIESVKHSQESNGEDKLTYVIDNNRIEQIYYSAEVGTGLNQVVKENVIIMELAQGSEVLQAWVFDRVVITVQTGNVLVFYEKSLLPGSLQP